MTRVAEKAGRLLVRDFGEVEQLQVSQKGPADFVTQADTKSEKLIREELSRARPTYGFMGEESAATKPQTEYTWIVDPLDGTTNFMHGIPHWAVSIALMKEDQVIAGVIYEPIRDEMFWCEKGTGVYQNANRLRVSNRNKLNECLLATGVPFKGMEKGPFIDDLNKVMMQISGIRRMGAASLDLAYVAAGRYDGYWERGLKPWDVAAGCLMVTEAGGRVSPFNKGENPNLGADLLASNFHMHKQLCDILGAAPVAF
jgi:myo-inositol-1(or 4)-monophosphatase